MNAPRVTAALALVAATLAGCRSKDSAPPPAAKAADRAPPAAQAPPGTAAPAAPAAAAPAAPRPATGGAPSLDEIRGQRQVREQQRETLVRNYVRLGDEAYAASRFEEAREHYRDALELDPVNDHARRRLTQVGAVLGEEPLTAGQIFDEQVDVYRVRAQQARVEVANLVAQARQEEQSGDFEAAIDLYDRALVIVNLYPTTADFVPTEDGLRQLKSGARERAERAAEARRRRQIQEASDIARREAAAQRAARRAHVQELFRQANAAMERGNYQTARNLAEQILAEEPQNEPAKRLRYLALNAENHELEDLQRRALIDEWKHVFQGLAEAYTPQVDYYTFPDTWADIQSQRRPPLLSNAAEMREDPQNRNVVNRLVGTPIRVNFQATPLQEAVDYLARVTGANIVVLQEAREGKSDEELAITLKLDSPVPASQVLDLATQLTGLAWKVENGVVQVTTTEGARGVAIVQLYDVKDLATPINNFPGEEINLDPTGESFEYEEPPEPVAEFVLTGIQELIENNVDRTVWEEGVGSVEALEPGTLVIKAPPETHRKIQTLLDGLRGAGGLQVSIETRFVTVADNFLQDIGVDLRGLGDQSGGVGIPGKGGLPGPGGTTIPVTFDDVFFGSAGQPQGIGTGNDVGIFYNMNSDGDVRARFENLYDTSLGKEGVLTTLGGLSFQGTMIDDTQLEVILRAVEKSERSTMVVAPRLTAYNGQRANVTVLNQVSYISDFDVEIAQAAQIGDPIVQTLRDGVVLDLRPVVSADRRFITMELRPTIAILTRPIATFQTTLANGPPVTIQLPELKIQRVRTTVNMPDGGTLLLGGLKFFEEKRLESTVPWLDKIPVANFFFKRQGTYLEKRNLLVLIRARILRPEENEPASRRGL